MNSNFNSHAHVERDTEILVDFSKEWISTHTLTWSVTIADITWFFIPVISTHTLTWSVTHKIVTIYRSSVISTHTLTWSVTENDDDIGGMWQDFNSHAHVERDSNRGILNPLRKISTHTLTWSVR